ncbi:archaellin/type IV pilin N-terminal domain-containing protein [Methanogenium organophilum]|uniref:Flagellin n=1 Tax=Methanogenium organophilum TaxID=2199 RepID=A0A9X9T8D5_METOG|nr:archaellin/type IV pilin N-terminal domain-containing protein [Methanogenium organophilum]WAI01047.1 flagellin [Methanogenium organophilum]
MKQVIVKEEGFTGLEAAIVLIAFVVVAAAFSYVVLGAGFYTTQKSQEVVYTSVEMASSNLEVIGDVYGLAATPASGVDTIRFTVGLSAGGSPVDFSTVQIVFATSDTVKILDNETDLTAAVATGNWNISNGATTSDYLLEGQDKFTILAMPDSTLSANEEFNLEIRPSVGASFGLKRTIPAKVNSVNLLY